MNTSPAMDPEQRGSNVAALHDLGIDKHHLAQAYRDVFAMLDALPPAQRKGRARALLRVAGMSVLSLQGPVAAHTVAQRLTDLLARELPK